MRHYRGTGALKPGFTPSVISVTVGVYEIPNRFFGNGPDCRDYGLRVWPTLGVNNQRPIVSDENSNVAAISRFRILAFEHVHISGDQMQFGWQIGAALRLHGYLCGQAYNRCPNKRACAHLILPNSPSSEYRVSDIIRSDYPNRRIHVQVC